jgi:uncharacterized membrane protein
MAVMSQAAARAMLRVMILLALGLACERVPEQAAMRGDSGGARGTGPRIRPDTAAALSDTAAQDVWAQARARGIDFRALGQEPGWLLEIEDGKQITMVADYGERRVTTPAPQPELNIDAGETIYRVATDAHRLRIVLRNEPCADVMSGERYPTTVVVELDGQEYRGCGRVP